MDIKYLIAFVFFLVIILLFINAESGCDKEQSCTQDNDCVKIQMDCCSCSVGGQEMCVPTSMKKVYQDKLKDCPNQTNFACPQVNRCENISCFCREGRCDVMKNF